MMGESFTVRQAQSRVRLQDQRMRLHAAFLERALLPRLMNDLLQRFKDYNNQTQEDTE